MFSVIHDINVFTERNEDLKRIRDWAFRWKIIFNSDANKQAEEVIISQWCIIGLPGALFKPEFEKMKKSPL